MLRKVVKGFVACVLALCAGCGVSGTADRERDERGSALYRKAFAAEQSGDLKEAIRLYNRVLIDEPHSFSAHFQLATLLHDHEEDYVGAIYHYKQYLYLRPDSEKNTLAQERIRIAEQLLAPQILKKVGDSVQGISQAHLLKENARLNGLITKLEGEKSVLLEGKAKAEKEAEGLKGDNDRLRDILKKMRVSESVDVPARPLARRDEAVVKEESLATPAAKMDAKSLRALREEAAALAGPDKEKAALRKPLVDVPSTEDVLKKVQSKLEGGAEKAAAEAEKKETAAVKQDAPSAKPEASAKPAAPDFSALSFFGRGDKKEAAPKAGAEVRTYVVQPGDTLFRVSEKYYGDSTKWRKIRDANRTRIDPDGRIRAGQIIIVP